VSSYPPARLLWIVGGEQHTEALINAAEWIHANAHLVGPLLYGPGQDTPCDACWRAAAYAVKGVLLAGYQKATNIPAEG
jgi:hypothetical protein